MLKERERKGIKKGEMLIDIFVIIVTKSKTGDIYIYIYIIISVLPKGRSFTANSGTKAQFCS